MSQPLNTTNRVVWREGTLLCPQHFQQQERHFLDQTRRQLELSRPYPWGIEHIELHALALRQGEFHVQALRAIMPDGLQIALGETDPLPPSRAFDEIFPHEQSGLTVYLAVPKETPGVPSYDQRSDQLQDPDRKTRYCVHTQDKYDRTREHELSPVETAGVRSRILFGKESKEGFTTLPIARIIRIQEGFALEQEYIPPSLTLNATGALRERVLRLLAAARARVTLLKKHRTHRSDQSLELSARDTGIYMWLFALGGQVGSLKALLEYPELAPQALYQELCAMQGQLSALATTLEEEADYLYDHNDLQHTFVPLIARIHQLIEFPFRQSHLSLDLTRRADGMWLGNLDAELLAARGDIVLAITSEHEPDEMAHRLPQLSKLAGFTQVTDLVDSALPGARLRALRQPPETIPTRAKTMYFGITPQDPYWQGIVDEKGIALFLGAPFDHAEMEVRLMVGLHGTRESIVPL